LRASFRRVAWGHLQGFKCKAGAGTLALGHESTHVTPRRYPRHEHSGFVDVRALVGGVCSVIDAGNRTRLGRSRDSSDRDPQRHHNTTGADRTAGYWASAMSLK
jgi:hypothetical protein